MGLQLLNLYKSKSQKDCALKLNLFKKFKLLVYDNAVVNKERMKRINDKHIQRRTFEMGEIVQLYNSRLIPFPRKLKLRLNGPCAVVIASLFGAIKIKYEHDEFIINGARLKKNFLSVPITFSKK